MDMIEKNKAPGTNNDQSKLFQSACPVHTKTKKIDLRTSVLASKFSGCNAVHPACLAEARSFPD